MSEPEIKPGDIVRLKSGGPWMTVEEVGLKQLGHENRSIRCIWFDDTQDCNADLFEPLTLIKQEQDQ